MSYKSSFLTFILLFCRPKNQSSIRDVSVVLIQEGYAQVSMLSPAVFIGLKDSLQVSINYNNPQVTRHLNDI